MRHSTSSRLLVGIVLTALASVIAFPVLAHPPTPLRVVAQFLDLSEEQAQQLAALRAAAADEIAPIVQEIATRKAALQQILSGEDPDPLEVGALVVSIHSLERQVRMIQQAVTDEFRTLLDDEQLQRLNAVDRAEPLCRVAPAFEALHLI
ncbi:MAG: Spy/CpxP family protein refolding chaperone [Acidobacteriota bacterium]